MEVNQKRKNGIHDNDDLLCYVYVYVNLVLFYFTLLKNQSNIYTSFVTYWNKIINELNSYNKYKKRLISYKKIQKKIMISEATAGSHRI